jgi:hypothetical protein
MDHARSWIGLEEAGQLDDVALPTYLACKERPIGTQCDVIELLTDPGRSDLFPNSARLPNTHPSVERPDEKLTALAREDDLQDLGCVML